MRDRGKHERLWLLLTMGGLLVPLALASCQQSLPSAPSELTSGVTIYQDANYRGESALLTRSSDDLSDYEGPCVHTDSSGGLDRYDWEDCISAVRIAPGWRATLYRDRNYKGEAVEVTGDLPNLQLATGTCNHDGMNDCVSSIKVVPPMFQTGAGTPND